MDDPLGPLSGTYSAWDRTIDYEYGFAVRLDAAGGARTFAVTDFTCHILVGGMGGPAYGRIVSVWRGAWTAEGDRLPLPSDAHGEVEGWDEERWPEPTAFKPDATRFTVTFQTAAGEALEPREAALLAAVATPIVLFVESDALPGMGAYLAEPLPLERERPKPRATTP